MCGTHWMLSGHLVTSGPFWQSAQATSNVHNGKFSRSDAQSICQPVSGQVPAASQLGCTAQAWLLSSSVLQEEVT